MTPEPSVVLYKPLYRVKDMAEAVSMSVSTIHRYIAEGLIEVSKARGCTMITGETVKAFRDAIVAGKLN